jgi:hypothetical protein
MACASCSGVRFEKLPRMADFALWAMAGETAFWPTGTFARSYEVFVPDAADGTDDVAATGSASDVLERDPAVCLQFGPRGTRTFTL